MRKTIRIFLLVFLSGLFLAANASRAQLVFVPFPDVTLSAGYSNLVTHKSDNLFYDHSGEFADLDFAWRLPVVLPLQLGFGLTGSGYSDRKSIDSFSDTNFDDRFDHLYSDMGMFEFEPRIGVRLGRPTGFFATPRFGAGLLVDSYSVDQSTVNDDTLYLSTRHHTGAAFEMRPEIQVGYSWGWGSAGAEGSYMYSWGDFGGFGHDAQEYRVGLFLSFQF